MVPIGQACVSGRELSCGLVSLIVLLTGTLMWWCAVFYLRNMAAAVGAYRETRGN